MKLKQTRLAIQNTGITTLLALTLAACGGGESSTDSGLLSSSVVETGDLAPVVASTDESNPGTSASTPSQSAPTAAISATLSASPNSGTASLQVNFSASNEGSANITAYNWNFGDGNTASGQNVTHIYNTPNTYTTTLTLTAANGDTGTATNQIYVFNSISNNQAIVPDGVIFYDDFDYAVSRNSADLATERAKFIANGWSGAKAVNLTGSHAGYLYTVNRIPGYSGGFPGRNSTRVLAFEAKPDTFGSQTDFYLQYGFNGQTIPADVWFQFWMYINNYDDPTDQEDQMSRFGRKGKILYPTKSGYPSNNGLWMLGCCATNYGPLFDDVGDAATSMYMHLADLQYLQFNDGNTSSYKVGQTDLSERFTPNHWMLVKTHIDTSTTSGKFEQWIKPMNGNWTKTADWEDGVSADFSWQIPASEVGGHVAVRLGTTFNTCREDLTQQCNFWLYFDDFSMANSEDTLPVYPY